MEIVANNKKAFFNYFISDLTEAGIELQGCEVKSIRDKGISLNESYVVFKKGELFLLNAYIKPFDKAKSFVPDERRTRKLLLHKSEIAKIAGKINRQGYTLVPLKLYFKDALVKIEVALCRGKHTYDKKQSIAERDVKRSVERDIKNAGF